MNGKSPRKIPLKSPTRKTRSRCSYIAFPSSQSPLQYASQNRNKKIETHDIIIKHLSFFLRLREGISSNTRGSRVRQSSEKKNQTGQIHTLCLPMGRNCNKFRKMRQKNKRTSRFPRFDLHTAAPQSTPPKKIDSDQLPNCFPVIVIKGCKKKNRFQYSDAANKNRSSSQEPRQPKVFPVSD